MKILYVATVSGTINAFLVPHITMLLELGHKVDIACNITRPISEILLNSGCNIYNMKFNRSPLAKENLKEYAHLKKVIKEEKYDLVHTHTPVASAIVRLACKDIKNVKVFYTAHGLHFYKGALLRNWLIFYPIERWLAKYTDVLITINREDFKRSKKLLKAKRIEYIPGVGLDTRKFGDIFIDRIKKRQEIGIPEDAFLILSTGELNKNKNHETIIRAIAKLNNTNIYYVICGQGPLENYLNRLIKEIKLNKQVKLLGFRNDIDEICKVSDIFAFPSYREGLGIAALEAMASGLPLITSNVHGIPDYSINGVTGFSYSPSNVDGFANAIDILYRDVRLREKIRRHNSVVAQKYDVKNIISKMKNIYGI